MKRYAGNYQCHYERRYFSYTSKTFLVNAGARFWYQKATVCNGWKRGVHISGTQWTVDKDNLLETQVYLTAHSLLGRRKIDMAHWLTLSILGSTQNSRKKAGIEHLPHQPCEAIIRSVTELISWLWTLHRRNFTRRQKIRQDGLIGLCTSDS